MKLLVQLCPWLRLIRAWEFKAWHNDKLQCGASQVDMALSSTELFRTLACTWLLAELGVICAPSHTHTHAAAAAAAAAAAIHHRTQLPCRQVSRHAPHGPLYKCRHGKKLKIKLSPDPLNFYNPALRPAILIYIYIYIYIYTYLCSLCLFIYTTLTRWVR